MSVTKVLVALYNMGGPTEVADVPEFLKALFEDNDLLGFPFPDLTQKPAAAFIVNRRLHEVQERYKLIGGSPQQRITDDVCKGLFDRLKKSNGRFQFVDVVSTMRYTSPGFPELWKRVQDTSANEVWFFSQYPHCSRPTTGSFMRALGLQNKQIKMRNFSPTCFDTDFVDLWVERVRKTWEGVSGKKHLIVSAHSIPKSYVANGDPYALQIERFAIDVMKKFRLVQGLDWSLAWQSAVGPSKWLGPNVYDHLAALRKTGIDNIVIWPVSFVSDHIETLFEIDMDFGEVAKKLGFQSFKRVANLNTDADYLGYLDSVITKAATDLNQPAGRSNDIYSFEDEQFGTHCHLQPGGCLCRRYYRAGVDGQQNGTPF